MKCFAPAIALVGFFVGEGYAADNAPPDGFVALFNGKDLSGWKGLVADPPSRAKMSPEQLAAEQEKADNSMQEHWKVENGVLIFDGKGKSLCTAKDYGNFEMYVDWKIPKDGDSGIYLRGTPQVQIWDTALVKVAHRLGRAACTTIRKTQRTRWSRPTNPWENGTRSTSRWKGKK